jgi:tripartite-type tricarboxylate transporter receptor subunit TctC
MKAKAEKGEVFFGVPTASSLASAQLYLTLTGLKATRVNYKSMGDAASDVAAGEIDFAFVDTTLAVAQAKQGRVRVLAVSPAERLAGSPELPTMEEAGLKGYQYINFWAAWLPAKAPADIVAKLAGWFNAVSTTEETKQFLVRQGSDPAHGTPAELEQMMKDHHQQWVEIAREAHLVPQ